MKDGLKEASQHLKTVISKTSNIVSHVWRSIHASEILDNENRLQDQNLTRWNSQLHMIKSVLKVPEEKQNSVECNVTLPSKERKLLQELCTILNPFEDATMQVQQQENVSASLNIPVTFGLKHQIDEISVTYNNKMVNTLKASTEKRISGYEKYGSYIVAAVLDPRFRIRWCTDDNQEHVESVLQKCTSSVSSNDNSV